MTPQYQNITNVPKSLVGIRGYTIYMATNRIKTVAYLEPKDRKGLNKLSTETGATVSKIVERAIKHLLKKEK